MEKSHVIIGRGKFYGPVRNNFSKRHCFDVESKSQKFSKISIGFDGFLTPISINFRVGNKILN